MKLSYLAAAAVLALSSPAYAGNDNGPKGGDVTVENRPVTTIENKPVTTISPTNTVTGPVTTITNAPKVEANGGSASLGSLNKFGGDSFAGADADANSLSASLSKAASKAASDAAASASQHQNALSTIAGSGNADVDVDGNNANQRTDINIDASTEYKRNPVGMAYAAPVAFGQGTCGVSASAGGQGITGALSLAIPLPSPKCEVRYVVQTLSALGSATGDKTLFRAAELYYAKHTKGVSEAITDARTGK